MTKKLKFDFKLLYGAALTVSIIVCGICLIGACLGIYYAGDGYSPEAVSEAFSPISIPVYVCLALTVGGFILSAIDAEKKKRTSKAISANLLAVLKSKRDISKADEETLSFVLKERKRRLVILVSESIIIAVCAAVFLIYALNTSNYHTSEINESMIAAMQVFAPCLAISFVAALSGILLNENSMKREIELLRQIPSFIIIGKEDVSSSNNKADKANKKAKKDHAIFAVKIAILVVAAAALIYGAIAGGTADVLTKAVNICTECIGLG